jgi:hypothetical protein
MAIDEDMLYTQRERYRNGCYSCRGIAVVETYWHGVGFNQSKRINKSVVNYNKLDNGY